MNKRKLIPDTNIADSCVKSSPDSEYVSSFPLPPTIFRRHSPYFPLVKKKTILFQKCAVEGKKLIFHNFLHFRVTNLP